MKGILEIVPSVLIYFWALSLASRSRYNEIIQVSLPGAGPDGVMQVPGWPDAGPRMVRCRIPGIQILEMETLPGKVRALLKEINELYGQ